jgi:DNA-directed RNA polymerase specialized sigma24 family protein
LRVKGLKRLQALKRVQIPTYSTENRIYHIITDDMCEKADLDKPCIVVKEGRRYTHSCELTSQESSLVSHVDSHHGVLDRVQIATLFNNYNNAVSIASAINSKLRDSADNLLRRESSEAIVYVGMPEEEVERSLNEYRKKVLAIILESDEHKDTVVSLGYSSSSLYYLPENTAKLYGLNDAYLYFVEHSLNRPISERSRAVAISLGRGHVRETMVSLLMNNEGSYPYKEIVALGDSVWLDTAKPFSEILNHKTAGRLTLVRDGNDLRFDVNFDESLMIGDTRLFIDLSEGKGVAVFDNYKASIYMTEAEIDAIYRYYKYRESGGEIDKYVAALSRDLYLIEKAASLRSGRYKESSIGRVFAVSHKDKTRLPDYVDLLLNSDPDEPIWEGELHLLTRAWYVRDMQDAYNRLLAGLRPIVIEMVERNRLDWMPREDQVQEGYVSILPGISGKKFDLYYGTKLVTYVARTALNYFKNMQRAADTTIRDPSMTKTAYLPQSDTFDETDPTVVKRSPTVEIKGFSTSHIDLSKLQDKIRGVLESAGISERKMLLLIPVLNGQELTAREAAAVLGITYGSYTTMRSTLLVALRQNEQLREVFKEYLDLTEHNE